MDRRLTAIIAATVLLGGVVAVVLISRGGGDSDSGSAEAGSKPTVEVPDGEPPQELVSEDLSEGEGATAETGDTVTVEYVGVDYETGEEFDSSWERADPFQFQLGGGQVIDGWDEGVVGMKEGGRRQLIIPPDLAYGQQGAPPDIGRNATLVFVVDLVSVDG